MSFNSFKWAYEMLKAWDLSILSRTIRKYGRQEYYRALLLTWPASLQFYLKTTGLSCNSNMAAVSFFGTPLWPPWRPCGNVLYNSEVCICFPVTYSRLSIATHPLVASARPLWLSSHIYLVMGPWKKREPLKNLRYVIQLYDIICSHHL